MSSKKPVRQYVQFASVEVFPDRKGKRRNERDYYKCCEKRAAVDRDLHEVGLTD